MSIASLVQDLRYTLRTLRRDAGFAIFAIAIAGLGIGASATVFSVLNALLLRVSASWILARSLSGLLFGVTATDPVTFLGRALVLAIVATLAGYLPARRASRIDPIVALRVE